MSLSHKASVVEMGGISGAAARTRLDNNLPLSNAVRVFPKITMYTFGAMMGILFVGYDTVIVGSVTAIPRFQQDFGDPSSDSNHKWTLPATWIALWSAFGPIGAVIAGCFAGWFQEKVGRKLSLALGSCIAICAITVMFCSNLPSTVMAKRACFLASKLLQGGSVGIILATTQTYVSEIVPVSLRGSAMALFPAFILLGQLAGAGVIFAMSKDSTPKSYLVSFASQWPFAILPLLMSFLMPQSPAWLLRNDRVDEARKSQSRLITQSLECDTAMEQLKKSIALERQLAADASWIACIKGVNRRRTMIVVLASSITNFFGLPLLASASYFMQQVGMSAHDSLLFLILGIVLGAISNGVGVWLMSRSGRRVLTVTTMSIATILWIAMGISGVWDGQVTIWYTAISMMVIVVVCGIGCWPASFAVAAEVSSLQLRARSQGISVFVSQVENIALSLILPYIYNPDAGNLKAKTGFLYGAICAIGTILSWFFIPEMKDRSAAEIDDMFQMRISTRKFDGFRVREE